jgi:hypothetical protein
VICEPVRLDDPLPPPPEIERGTVGASPERAAHSRPAHLERGLAARSAPGLVGRVMKMLADEPSSVTASANGSEGERRLTRLLDTELVDAVTLHDRKAPTTRGHLDHLVIASSGIWLISARRSPCEVECRSTGSFGSSQPRLYVDGRNQTRLVDSMAWPVAAVRAQLDTIGFGSVPVHPVVCFTSSRWTRGVSPFEVHGVLVTWPTALIEPIGAPGPLDVRLVELVARHLGSTLQASGSSAAPGSR